jgi:hypothetical protein
MGDIIQINGKDIKIKEYKGQRVITFKDIDEVHERPEGTASRNFSQNKHRFIEGEDYFYLTKTEMESTKFVNYSSPKGLTLITESGYLMLVKSFTDDLAWQVQRQLVNVYFRAKEIRDIYQNMTQLQILKQIVDNMVEQEKITKEIQEKQREFEIKMVEQSKNIDTLNAIVSVENQETLRQKFNAAVKAWAYKEQLTMPQAYKEVYKIIRNNQHIDIKSRAVRRSIKPIDVLEQDGLLEYALRIVNEKLNNNKKDKSA